jgi:NitT/TauT family transport system permease protein
MALVLFHTRNVKAALRRPASMGVEFLVLLVIAGLVGTALLFGRQFSAPMTEKVTINLSLWALPKYVLLTTVRGYAAYVISLAFTLIYGTIAAHNHRAEKIMLPALDILQAIPVLSFLPGLVLLMIGIFPNREMGLELACIIMIFTAQAWNMTFSFHGSLRGIPTNLREVATLNHFTGWQIFKLLEVPAAMIGLVWNSMMSMAGGWFFITVNEAFQLGGHDYRLPGIGSYMQEAIDKDNFRAQLAAVIAMTTMIVVVDRLFWRPIVVWSQRFKVEEQVAADASQSWILTTFQKSALLNWIRKIIHRLPRPHKQRHVRLVRTIIQKYPKETIGKARGVMTWLLVGLLAAWGAFSLLRLLLGVHFYDWGEIALKLGASFLRTSSAVALGAAWALPAGIMIGRSPVWSRRLQPVVQSAASFPAPMLFPWVTMLLVALHIPFNIGCVALMLLGSQWYILFNVIAGASSIPTDLSEVSNAYRMSRMQKWTKLYMPAVFPNLVTGLITATGGAWNATIVSEYLKIGDTSYQAFGLGSLIADVSQGNTPGSYSKLAGATVAMSVFVVLLNRFFWKRLYRLSESRYSLNM